MNLRLKWNYFVKLNIIKILKKKLIISSKGIKTLRYSNLSKERWKSVRTLADDTNIAIIKANKSWIYVLLSETQIILLYMQKITSKMDEKVFFNEEVWCVRVIFLKTSHQVVVCWKRKLHSWATYTKRWRWALCTFHNLSNVRESGWKTSAFEYKYYQLKSYQSFWITGLSCPVK